MFEFSNNLITLTKISIERHIKVAKIIATLQISKTNLSDKNCPDRS